MGPGVVTVQGPRARHPAASHRSDRRVPARPSRRIARGPQHRQRDRRRHGAAIVVATQDDRVAAALQPLFASSVFRVYRNTDVLGCELGGILKNIVAIASGMADGLGVGDNTRAMVLARGLAEMTRLGEAMGANPRTFAGLTGVGDLIATCMAPTSRNRRVGEALAQGLTVEEAVAKLGQVAEGVKTAPTVMDLAREYGVDMPIAAEVEAVIGGRQSASDAYRGLQKVAPGGEHEVA